MLNLLTKTKPWIVASLLVATYVFGQSNNNPGGKPASAPCAKPCPTSECKPKTCPTPCPQPCPPTQLCPPQCPSPCCPPWPVPVLNAAYNYPARVMTRCPWDLFGDISFIYWQPIQENMEVAYANETAITGTDLCVNGVDGRFVNMKFNYKPGFKIGLGGNFDYDNWDVHVEYTWFHNTQKQSSQAPLGGQLFATFGMPVDCTTTSGPNTVNVYGSVDAKWRLNLDVVDLTLGRWGYYGTKMTMHPYFGARATFIRQKLDLTYANNGLLGAGTAETAELVGKANSWAVGPEIGIDTNWNLGSGFRLFGNAETDISFTKYTKLSFAQGTFVHSNQNKDIALRTHCDFEMGLGWGTYFDCNNWYLDFAASYGFQAFFDQNMFRLWAQSPAFGAKSLSPNGDLYVHGLTLTAKLDF